MKVVIRGAGPAVVKIPGLAGGVGLLREEIAAAAAHGYRVAALDPTGDRADDPLGSAPSWERYAAETVAAIDRLGADRAVLWGTSFGTTIALATALRAPERVRGLLLSFPPDPSFRPRLWLRLLRRVDRSRNPDRVARATFTLVFPALSVWEFLWPPAIARVPSLWRAGREAATPGSTLRGKLRLLWGGDPIEGIERLAVPARIVAARLDTVAPLRRARRLAARIPGARVDVLEMAGHAGQWSRPRRYAAMALDALDAIAERG